jgi:hypothetical protein
MVELNCDFCLKKIHKQPAYLKRYQHHFCGRECFTKWQRKIWVYPKKEKKQSFFHRLKESLGGVQ